jgi:hypothetical protein
MYLLYLENDVWGNFKDGYEVNNCVLTNVCLELPENFTDKELFAKLKKAGIINKYKHFKGLEIDGEIDFQLFMRYKEYPFGDLRPIKEGEMITFTNMHREFKASDFDVY